MKNRLAETLALLACALVGAALAWAFLSYL